MWVATSCIALVQGVWIVFYTVMKVPEREEGSRKQPLMGHGEAQV